MIAHVCAYLPPHLGGAEQQIANLLERLSDAGEKVEAYSTGEDRFLGNVRVNGVGFFEIFRTPIALGLFFRLMRDVSKKRIEILHVHVAQAFFPEIAFLVSRIKKIPLVVHLRGDVPASSFFGRFFLGAYKKLVLGRILRYADRVIVLNEDYKDFVSDFYGVKEERIRVVPNAIDGFENFRCERDLKRVLFVGRLSEEKNVDAAIKAMKYLKGFRLYVVGDGPLRKKLEGIVEKEGLGERVFFLGRMQRKDVFEEYKKSCCVVLPSSVEVFSSVILEAMALGCVVVASDVRGTRSVVKSERNGILTGIDSKEIADAILRVSRDDNLRRKIVRNAKRDVRKYSWEKVVEGIGKIYRELEG